MTFIDYLILTITILNLVILLSVSSFLIGIADAVKYLNKNIDEYLYLNTNTHQSNQPKNEEKNLVDI